MGRLGFLTELLPGVVEFAGANGLSTLELICDRDTTLDVEKMGVDELDALKARLDENNVALGAFAWYITNQIEPDTAKQAENTEYLKKIISAGKKLGCSLISIGTMHHPSLEVKGHTAESLEIYKKVFGEYARIAEAEGFKLCFENCPEFGNIMYSPEILSALFELVPSPAIGLEYDPSHFVWQGIDYLRALRDYQDRVFSVHCKDTRIIEDNLYKYGICGRMIGEATPADEWWGFCLPGRGKVDWAALFAQLDKAGYNGPVFIENEDPEYEGSPVFTGKESEQNKRNEGLLLTKTFLEKFIG